MQLNFSDDDVRFQEKVRQFVETEISEAVRDKVRRGIGLTREELVEGHRKLDSMGWACPFWPVEWGGCDWTAIQHYLFQQTLGECCSPGALTFNTSMVGPVIFTFGTTEQKKRFLPGIKSGDVFWCQGYSEPNSGSDLASLQTKAVLEGDEYIVNGQKTWTTHGHWADWIFCLVRTNSSGKKQEGISFLLFDMKSPGVTVEPIITMEGGHEVNQVFFDSVRVPVENLIGEQDKGWTYAKFLLGYERSTFGETPRNKRRLNRLRQIASEEQHYGKPLITDRRFRQKLADAEVQIRTLEATELRGLAASASGEPPGPEASFIKIRGSELDQYLTELMVEAVGNYMLPQVPETEIPATNQTPIGAGDAAIAAPTYFNRRKVSIYGGSNEIQKNIIAKVVLGL